jgi:antitoxin component YwqK of YwqJK toxin-antitoxin module
MKRLILIGFFQLLLYSSFSQAITDNHINQADNLGRKQGVWRIYDDDGNLKFTGAYYNGKPISDFKFFYPGGKIKAVIIHIDSGRVSYAKNYYENGNMMATGKYIGQKKDSTWTFYSEEDGKLSVEENYTEGLKNGLSRTYYPEGQVAEQFIYVNDKKDGEWLQYFTDGKVKLKATYKNDLIEGLYIMYHFNGMVEVSGNYSNNLKDGTWVYMSDIGEMEKREIYKDGFLEKQELLIEQK